MLLSRHQNASQINYIKIENGLFENVALFKCLEMRVKNQHLIQEKIKRRLDYGNSCYHSVQDLLSSRLLPTEVKKSRIRVYKTIILPLILHGCETWSLTLREEHIPTIFENAVLRRIFGPRRDEVTGGWTKLLDEELHNLLFKYN
jgi:hypothetical protein